MNMKFADRVSNIQPSAIRELLKLTQQPGMISFAGGLPAPELFPIDEIRKVCDSVLLEAGKAALQYSTTEGHIPLRKFIAERLESSGVKIDFSNILITNGSQQGLDFTGKLFVNEGDVIICESPSYVGAINAFKQYLPRFVEIAMDDDGMIMEELEKALEEFPDAKFIYTIPDFQNPTGLTMSLERRKKLVEVAVKYGVPVVEDNPYGELRFEGKRLPAVKHFDKDDAVIYLGSFSKTFCPGLRIGWVAASPEIVRKYVLIKQGADLQANTLAQMEVATFIEMFDFDKHIEKIIHVYRSRRDAMLNTMKETFPDNVRYTFPNGGLFTWVDLPEGVDAEDVFKKAVERKVAFVPGGSFYPNGGNKNHFRLNYATMDEELIVEGITRLAEVLKEMI